MAYSVSNPPVCVTPRIGSGPALWIYNSADIHTDVDGADYFTNGKKLGMRVGDHVLAGRTATAIGVTVHYVTAVTAAGATVSSAILA